MKRILLTEWGVEPRVYSLDEFIKAQCFDVQGNHIMPENGGMRCEEIDSLRNLQIADKVRIGDPDCTEIYVERLGDAEEFFNREFAVPPNNTAKELAQRAMTWEDGEGIALIFTQISYLCDRLAIELPKTEPSPDDGLEICAAERATIVAHLIDDWLIR